MIEALISIRIPELWVTPVTENYDIELSCQVGGAAGKGGWGLATIKGEDAVLQHVVEEIREHPSVGGVKVQSRGRGMVTLIVDVVKCKACEVLIRSKTFMVFPVSIARGRMKWLLVTDNNRTIGRISNELERLGCDVSIERIVPLNGKGILTSRQEEVIHKALSRGYFDYPRKTNSIELAQELGISVSTLSEVIRSAQRRIFTGY